ncbi:TIGR03084 family metal-binding protein [Kitasatospora sp. NPDC088391]|uniref:TIGR03084 family metal-binding protein n=1 Tax=Kitasatospora sp. NPDC088391 TaxID=3364074 RepID=UPI003816B653
MTAMQDVCVDLATEGAELAALVAGLPPGRWSAPTPSPGWTVRHQVAHLSMVARLVALAVRDPAAFERATAPVRSDFEAGMTALLDEELALPEGELTDRWARNRAAAEQALAAVPRPEPVPWLAGPLPASVLAAAGLMELFAHGHDVRDALGLPHEHTDRIGHVAFLGTRTRDLAHHLRGLEPPAEPFRYELTAPSGVRWDFGPADAEQRVTGPAVDFCLLVTRRRHRADLALTATGAAADRWLDIAQTYMGPPGPGGARTGQSRV